MKTRESALACDHCGKPIKDTGVAMVFFEINAQEQVTALHLSHKGDCDKWGSSRSIELDDFRERPLLQLQELIEDYAWTGPQLARLIGIASATEGN